MSLLDETVAAIPPLDVAAMDAARERLDQLTKPRGSLGRLEDLVVQLAGVRGAAMPSIERRAIVVMAADHGVAARGVSAYPSEVTGQMVANFLSGGAAISALGRQLGARLVVVDMGVATAIPPRDDLLSRRLGPGTADLSAGPAMTERQALAGIEAGIEIAASLAADGVELIVPGEMGIGNSTAAAAIVAVLTGRPAAEVTGRGTGLADPELARKIALIDAAIAGHRLGAGDPIAVLATVGGFEIAGIVGLLLGSGAARVAVLLDGFIVGAAALVAVALAPALGPHLNAGHRSAEPGHRVVLDALGLRPILELDLRLGEGSGAAVALGVVDATVRLYREMATFEEAAVSGRATETGNAR
ncbi:MAG: nicotinate-nucleotide--dimethylbenzimidazole phosphoribosyltransferase [Chloroflexota bacterium]|nr:nicotinate-nucleotide--dimethylbenzimidazole phosphoribosyltransferase [Chloroflexota bacterium]